VQQFVHCSVTFPQMPPKGGPRGKISKRGEGIVAKTVKKYYHGELHSGPGKKRLAKSPKQALAIGYAKARK